MMVWKMILLSFIVSNKRVTSGQLKSYVEAKMDQEVGRGNRKRGSEVYYEFHE